MSILGYRFETPQSTAKLAGGVDQLLDLFASRARGYFRSQGIACDVIASHRYVEIHVPQRDDIDLVFGFRQRDPPTPDVVHISLTDFYTFPWTPLHEAFASLVKEWPEIAAWRPIQPPPPSAYRADFTPEELAQARAIVIADQRATTSYIQRKLRIGYNKAATIIERLEQDGVISAPDHAGKRQILADA